MSCFAASVPTAITSSGRSSAISRSRCCAQLRDLGRVRHAVAARFRIASGKAADHGADVHARAELLLVDAERSSNQANSRLPGRVGERPPIVHLARAGRLADEHHARVRHGAGHRLAHARSDRRGRRRARRDELQSRGSYVTITIPTMRRLGFVLASPVPPHRHRLDARLRRADREERRRARAARPAHAHREVRERLQARARRARRPTRERTRITTSSSRAKGRLRERIERETRGADQTPSAKASR